MGGPGTRAARRSGWSCCATTRCWTPTWTSGRSSTSSGSRGRTWCFTTDPSDRDTAATRHLLILAQQLHTTRRHPTKFNLAASSSLHLNKHHPPDRMTIFSLLLSSEDHIQCSLRQPMLVGMRRDAFWATAQMLGSSALPPGHSTTPLQ